MNLRNKRESSWNFYCVITNCDKQILQKESLVIMISTAHCLHFIYALFLLATFVRVGEFMLFKFRNEPKHEVVESDGECYDIASAKLNMSVDSWNGVKFTSSELNGVVALRDLVNEQDMAKVDSPAWLGSVTDVELLRFLRARNGNIKETWKMILNHAKWRSSFFGVDSEFSKQFKQTSPLNYEAFWLGLDKNDCPTLVIRTQIHDGIYYNEDPRIFAR